MGQYILTFNDTGELERVRGRKITKKVHASKGKVVSIQTQRGTLITRVNGRINFTGNCRLVKHSLILAQRPELFWVTCTA
ncbi:metallophosphoesterase [Xanthomonas phage JGB6]|nr:metallophosphoesterase [Xanthomonas phage JGB6]